jgi:hypothetical protein
MRESGECCVSDDDRIWHMLTPGAVLEGNQYAYRDTLSGRARRGPGRSTVRFAHERNALLAIGVSRTGPISVEIRLTFTARAGYLYS